MTKILKIEGMSCNHCTNHVTNVLNGLCNVTDAHVSLDDKQAIVHYDGNISDDIFRETIEEAGYDLVEIC